MNKIKLLSLLIAAATSIAALADGGTWNFSESNGTLTINASGDLTTASQSTTYKVFTDNAVGNVFTSENSSYTSVTQGANYIATDTYYEPQSSWTQLFTSNNNVPTTEGNYAYSISETYKWKESTAGANGVYFYAAYLSEETTWSVPENTYVYKIDEPKQDWVIAENTYIYPITYSPKQWVTEKTSGKYIYTAYFDNGTLKSDQGVADTNYDPTAGIYSEGTTYQTWEKIYVYSNESLGSLQYGQEFTIGSESGNVQYVPSDWISETPKIKISGNAVISGNDYPGDGNTFTYNNQAYYCYVTSTTQLSSGTEYTLSSLSGVGLITSLSGVGLITSMSDYHTLSDKVYVHKISQYSNYNVTNTTFNYNDNTYYLFATSSTDKGDGIKVAISDLTMVTDLSALSSYYTTKYKVNFYYNPTRYTDQDYTTQNAITYNGTSYAGYVKLSSAYNSGMTYYVDDEGVSLITESELKSTYLDGTITYYANNNLYRSTDNGTTKTLLTAGQQYTYSTGDTFYTPAATEYVAITNNAEYFGTGGTGESYIADHTENLTFKEALRLQILSGSYTKVEFVNTGSGELTIDPEIVQTIIAPDATPNGENRSYQNNTTITELDLGAAYTASLENLTHIYINENTIYYATNLEKLTLPTTVKNGGEMVLTKGAVYTGYLSNKLTTVTVPEEYTKIGDEAFAHGLMGSECFSTINLPSTLTEIGDSAFYGCSKLQYINNTLSRRIVFPSKLATIGESAFEVCNSLTSTESDPFILPSGLKKIKKSAFKDLTNLKFLQLNEGLEYVGNTAFGLNAATSEQTTITFPSTLKYLGPGSFINRWYQDVYFTGTKAPVCPVGKSAYIGWGNVTAFSVNTQMGNNGFDPIGAQSGSTVAEGSTAGDASRGYANRENYINNDAYYFTILHFPDSLTDAQAKTYRDITRRYVTGTFDAETGAFTYAGYGADIHDATDPNTKATYGSVFKEAVTDDAVSSLVYYMSSGGLLNVYTNSAKVQPGFIDTYLGAQQIWPSQSQWIRNFVTVANGVEWDGKTEYRPTVTEDMFDMMKADGLFVQANSLDYSTNRVADAENSHGYGQDFSLANITWSQLNDGTDEHNRMLAYLSLILYQGTRRFVLSYDGGYSIPFKVKLKGGRWWSICLPFNMTKAEVDSVFGGGNTGTHVCLMSAVDRTVTNNSTDGNTLVLKFKNDVYRHKPERTVTKSNTGYAYTYASNFSKSNAAPAEDDIVIYARESYMIYPVREDAGEDPVYYDFGSPVFETGDPLPTMVQANKENENEPYAINGSDPVYRFIGNFTTATTTDVTVKIPLYSYAFGRASSTATGSKFFILSTAGATWSPFKSIVQNTAGGDDDWSSFFGNGTARVNQVSLFGEDEEITGIQNIVIEASSDDDEDLRVFNLNGAQMGNSLQGLPAGTYIQGGKAYRVK